MTELATVEPNVKKADTLTVCIIAYNHARYIRQELDALVAQTYTRFKIVA